MKRMGLSMALFDGGMCLLAGMVLAGAMTTDGMTERAKRLHFSSLVIDTHADTTQRFLDGGFDFAARNELGSVDIPRMKEGGLGAIFFSDLDSQQDYRAGSGETRARPNRRGQGAGTQTSERSCACGNGGRNSRGSQAR